MVRKSSFLIGLGLALFWWIGLSVDHSATLLWFDAVGAVIAFGIGGLVDDTAEHNPANALGPAILGLGLAVIWIIAMASRQPAWVAWVNFGFAVVCLGLAVVTAGAHRHVELHSHA